MAVVSSLMVLQANLATSATTKTGLHRIGTRTTRDLLVLGSLHLDCVAHTCSFHELYATAEKGAGSSRDCYLYICW
jgi:hypothetical protein